MFDTRKGIPLMFNHLRLKMLVDKFSEKRVFHTQPFKQNVIIKNRQLTESKGAFLDVVMLAGYTVAHYHVWNEKQTLSSHSKIM